MLSRGLLAARRASEGSCLQAGFRVEMGKHDILVIRKDLVQRLKLKGMYCCKMQSLSLPAAYRIHFWALRFMR